MGQLIKMQITAYSSGNFSEKVGDTLSLQINPSSLKINKEVSYSEGKTLGSSNADLNFEQCKGATLSFDFLFDDTGIIPMPENKSLVVMINDLEKVVYQINGETHEPNYVQINWGSLVFNGRMSSLNYDYSLFRPDGSPLRVKVSMTFKNYINKVEESKIAGLKSSDLSRIVTLKAGENIALLCKQIYGDSSYCIDVADYNNLVDFRNVQIGTQLMFPPLSYGKFSE